MYSEASTLYFKAKTLRNKTSDPSENANDNDAHSLSLSVAKWSATLMWHICEQISHDSDVKRHEEFIVKIKMAHEKLKKENTIISRRYQLEAIIAVAGIHVQNARNKNNSVKKRDQCLADAKKELENIQHEKNMGIRTHSLLLQILGSTYSMLKEHGKAVQSLRQSLKEREDVLRPEHLDVARAKYRLALCHVEHIHTMTEKERKKNITEISDQLNEAQRLCNEAFKIQKTQLATDHGNLKECSDLRRNIDQFFEDMKSNKPLE
jgi:hypothetical protein